MGSFEEDIIRRLRDKAIDVAIDILNKSKLSRKDLQKAVDRLNVILKEIILFVNENNRVEKITREN